MSDPGDVVLSKFGYQFGYGVILLTGMLTRRLPYIALWCEQLEDFLAERVDGRFEAFQVKTRSADSQAGKWETNDEAFVKSIARFVDLDLRFPEQVAAFKFVSNMGYSDSSAKDREMYSPLRMLRAVLNAADWQTLPETAKKGFEALVKSVNQRPEVIFKVLKRTDLILGPSEDGLDAELCQNHIAAVDECRTMTAIILARVRESLIGLVRRASSLGTDDPSKSWVGLIRDTGIDPRLLSKRLNVDSARVAISDAQGPSFRYLPELASLELGNTKGKLTVLEKKLARGGLAAHFETMRRRSLSAEQILLDLVTRPQEGRQVLAQIESVVLTECDDAKLRASQTPEPYGAAMLIDVQDRLKRIAEKEPAQVHRQSSDMLIGVSGLLTSNCKVWWSDKFDVGGEP